MIEDLLGDVRDFETLRISDLIRGFLANQTVLIRRPKAIRPWQHVSDALAGYVLLAEQLLAQPQRFASAFNFGPNEEDA